MIKRYNIRKENKEASDFNYLDENSTGSLIRYEDHIKEKDSNVVNPLLNDVPYE